MRCYDDAMRHLLLSLVLLGSCESPSPKAPEPRPGELLIFTRTADYRHPSVDPGSICVAELGRELGLESTRTEDPADFNDENLKRFACVVFLNTTNDVLEANGEAAFERYIQAGGGVVADSVPQAEYQETMNKSRAVFRAAAMVQSAAREDS